MRKFLLIGVGGSGGATLRFIRNAISTRLDQAGYDGVFPEAWQFIQVDLPPNDDKQGGRIPASLGAAYHGIAPVGVSYDQHRRQLASRGDGAPLENLTTWWPDPNDAPKHPWHGAGQYRAVGRVVTLNRLGEIHRAVEGALASMGRDVAVTQLRDAGAKLGFDSTRQEDQPIVLVIGSMAGGTGAGAILDVCDLLRIMGAQGEAFLRAPFAVLYTAAVFANLDRAVVPGVEPNSLAFISEMSSMIKNRRPVVPVYHAAAGVTAELVERGPALSFLIGGGNGEVTLADEVAVFSATAQAITTWVVDPQVQSTLQASPIGNLEQLRKTRSHLPVHQHEPDDSQPCSSFGYARLELTNNRFHRYAAEFLGRHAVDHLLRKHLHLAGDNAQQAEALSQRMTPQTRARFLRDCGLSERDQTENQIIDAILEGAERSSGSSTQSATTLDAAVKAEAISQANAILDAPGASEKNFRPDQAAGQLERQVTARRPEFAHLWSGWLDAGVRQWEQEIQGRVVGAVTEMLATEGLVVTINLLDDVDADLDAATSELQGEATAARAYASTAFGRINVGAGGKRQRVSQTLREPFAKAAGECLEGEVQAMRRDKARDAITAFRAGFLDPLRNSLRSVEAALHQQWPTVQEWVEGDAVPGRFSPAPNEVVLTDIDRYPALLLRLLTESAGGNKSGVVDRVVKEMLQFGDADADPMVTDARVAPLISVNPWVPESNQRASFEIGIDAEQLRSRAAGWLVSDTSSGVGKYLTEPIQQTLANASAGEIKSFVSRFRMALERSAPLIDVNPATLNDIHQLGKPRFQRIMSVIPLPVSPGEPAYDAVHDLLASIGIEAASIPSYFRGEEDEDTPPGDIEISTFMSGYHPMVFASLVNPIAQAAQASASQGVRGFWDMRRSRPLTEFLPLSGRTVELMVQGWLVAGFLGQVDFTSEELLGHPYVSAAMLLPGGQRASFPLPGLGRLPGHRRDVLAAVLESYPLAEVQFATGQPSALDAYERLVRVGASRALAEWVQTGASEVGSPPEAATAEERSTLALDRFRDAQKALTAYDDEFTPNPEDWNLPPRGWEIRELVSSALNELIEIVQAAPAEQSAGAGHLDV